MRHAAGLLTNLVDMPATHLPTYPTITRIFSLDKQGEVQHPRAREKPFLLISCVTQRQSPLPRIPSTRLPAPLRPYCVAQQENRFAVRLREACLGRHLSLLFCWLSAPGQKTTHTASIGEVCRGVCWGHSSSRLVCIEDTASGVQKKEESKEEFKVEKLA